MSYRDDGDHLRGSHRASSVASFASGASFNPGRPPYLSNASHPSSSSHSSPSLEPQGSYSRHSSELRRESSSQGPFNPHFDQRDRARASDERFSRAEPARLPPLDTATRLQDMTDRFMMEVDRNRVLQGMVDSLELRVDTLEGALANTNAATRPTAHGPAYSNTQYADSFPDVKPRFIPRAVQTKAETDESARTYWAAIVAEPEPSRSEGFSPEGWELVSNSPTYSTQKQVTSAHATFCHDREGRPLVGGSGSSASPEWTETMSFAKSIIALLYEGGVVPLKQAHRDLVALVIERECATTRGVAPGEISGRNRLNSPSSLAPDVYRKAGANACGVRDLAATRYKDTDSKAEKKAGLPGVSSVPKTAVRAEKIGAEWKRLQNFEGYGRESSTPPPDIHSRAHEQDTYQGGGRGQDPPAKFELPPVAESYDAFIERTKEVETQGTAGCDEMATDVEGMNRSDSAGYRPDNEGSSTYVKDSVEPPQVNASKEEREQEGEMLGETSGSREKLRPPILLSSDSRTLQRAGLLGKGSDSNDVQPASDADEIASSSVTIIGPGASRVRVQGSTDQEVPPQGPTVLVCQLFSSPLACSSGPRQDDDRSVQQTSRASTWAVAPTTEVSPSGVPPRVPTPPPVPLVARKKTRKHSRQDDVDNGEPWISGQEEEECPNYYKPAGETKAQNLARLETKRARREAGVMGRGDVVPVKVVATGPSKDASKAVGKAAVSGTAGNGVNSAAGAGKKSKGKKKAEVDESGAEKRLTQTSLNRNPTFETIEIKGAAKPRTSGRNKGVRYDEPYWLGRTLNQLYDHVERLGIQEQVETLRQQGEPPADWLDTLKSTCQSAQVDLMRRTQLAADALAQQIKDAAAAEDDDADDDDGGPTEEDEE
ncbi:hypothetical protein P7C70_g4464, partial [Phenoliferia sp. Uapishka_3]